MSVGRPLPGDVVEDAIDQPFWDACREGIFLVYRCAECGKSFWPAGSCPTHGMQSTEWVRSSGRGRVHTWTVVHHKYSRTFTDSPTIVAVVQLDDGPFFHTNLTAVDFVELAVGLAVQVFFSADDEGMVLPVFRPVVPADDR
ncbi:Zn-ribbon domain-containing OB-fold protein [Rhodococcus sp. P1Y]|uniref:Zn-ribbon domain-containing OB-fold protein n=1 Tax=Rhodococcus sp. P1Y TaxID=1302308 RepID=UPI00137B3F07|nr:OB-fold domain-containing protein [Rhodococcus sp. P1Y]